MLTPVNIMVMMRGDGLCCYVIKAAFYPTRRPREGFGTFGCMPTLRIGLSKTNGRKILVLLNNMFTSDYFEYDVKEQIK